LQEELRALRRDSERHMRNLRDQNQDLKVHNNELKEELKKKATDPGLQRELVNCSLDFRQREQKLLQQK